MLMRVFMNALRSLLNSIDWLNNWTGKITSWLVLILTLMMASEVMMRYLFNAPTKWSYDVSWMMLAAFTALGLGHVLLRDENIRVDIIYSNLTPRTRFAIDTILTLVLLFPVAIILAWSSIDHTVYAWKVDEIGSRGYWMPPMFPVRLVVTIGIVLMAVQSISYFHRNLLALLKKGK